MSSNSTHTKNPPAVRPLTRGAATASFNALVKNRTALAVVFISLLLNACSTFNSRGLLALERGNLVEAEQLFAKEWETKQTLSRLITWVLSMKGEATEREQ
jgi:hypothetical protein